MFGSSCFFIQCCSLSLPGWRPDLGRRSSLYGWESVPRCRVYLKNGIKETGDIRISVRHLKNTCWFPPGFPTHAGSSTALRGRWCDFLSCRPIIGPTPPKLPALAAISSIIALPVICDRHTAPIWRSYNIALHKPKVKHFCTKISRFFCAKRRKEALQRNMVFALKPGTRYRVFGFLRIFPADPRESGQNTPESICFSGAILHLIK